ARPELAETAAEFLAGNRAVIMLDALDETNSEALLARLLEDTTLSAATTETLLRNAGGNPLFLEETVRMLEATEPEDLDAMPVPTSLQALIGSRRDPAPTRTSSRPSRFTSSNRAASRARSRTVRSNRRSTAPCRR